MKKNKTFTTTERDLAIAEFIGWFKQDDQPETWFEYFYENGKPTAKYVAYSEYKNVWGKGLPFSTDLNYLNKAILKLTKDIRRVNDSYKSETNEYLIDEFKIGLSQFYCLLIQDTSNGWRMFLGNSKNSELSILYIVGENCKDWNEGLYLFISDIILTIQGKRSV